MSGLIPEIYEIIFLKPKSITSHILRPSQGVNDNAFDGEQGIKGHILRRTKTIGNVRKHFMGISGHANLFQGNNGTNVTPLRSYTA